MRHDWADSTMKRWSRLFVYAIVVLFLPRSLNELVVTKYTLSTEFVQVRRNN
jgi:hypothetical protein